ncbi:putative ribosome-inactivating protein [Rosellinia necatrix]|uniref:Putative ribosome-inactivating protein n=1 Tax=Rosellinia necatrix TaxID=77044 RepID=A0A1W2TRG3_ROSNE|nr:putative ribosome-inactivating protein [Rosellinia necatrix]
MVKFTVDFAADDDSEAYDAFLIDLRNRLGVGERIENVPVLPPQVAAGGQLEFFDLNLSYTDRGSTFTVQVRFRTDNLYLVGYRPQGSNIWYELGHVDGGSRTLINEPGTTTEILRFGENYNGLTSAAGVSLANIPLSSTRIGGAITSLATNDTNLGVRARSILTVTFAVCEAARLRDISTLVSNAWWAESTPGIQFANRVRSWSRLSAAVQRTRNEGYAFDFDGGSTDIWSFVEAIRTLGIMHLKAGTSQSLAFRSERSIPDMADNQDTLAPYASYIKGQPLLEIFHVRIKSIDGESPGNLYGTIAVTDSAGAVSIWGRAQHDYVNIGPDEDILLEGPSRALSAADEFYIDLDLWDYDSLSPDDSIAKGQIAFNPLDYFTKYDVVEDREVTGDSGSVTVSYMAISDGLYAEITVVLINGDDEDPADVYGDITANNGSGQSQLFLKPSNGYVEVVVGQPIPLLRTVVAVPTKETLLINAHLWDHDPISPDDEIASGSAEFEPLYKKSESKDIAGAYGKIQVRVAWL